MHRSYVNPRMSDQLSEAHMFLWQGRVVETNNGQGRIGEDRDCRQECWSAPQPVQLATSPGIYGTGLRV